MSNSLVFFKKARSYLILTVSSPVDWKFGWFPQWEKWAQEYSDTFQTLLNLGFSVIHLCTGCFQGNCGHIQSMDNFTLGNLLENTFPLSLLCPFSHELVLLAFGIFSFRLRWKLAWPPMKPSRDSFSWCWFNIWVSLFSWLVGILFFFFNYTFL